MGEPPRIDVRTSEMREGAGLEESRLNVEFIDWLRRWSTPMTLVLIAIIGGWVVMQRVSRAKVQSVNKAFEELELVRGSSTPNPDSLLDVASNFDGIRAVGPMARLEAADVYLRAVQLGLRPGAEFNADGSPLAPEDVLTDERRNEFLSKADELYAKVAQDAASKPEFVLHRINGLYGSAAVAECRGEFDAAKKLYEQIAAEASKSGYATHEKLAKRRIEKLSTRLATPRLYAASEVAPLPWAPPPPKPTPPEPEKTEGEGEGESTAPPADPAPAEPVDQAPAEPVDPK